MPEEFLKVEALTKYFPISSFFSLWSDGGSCVKAVDGINFSVRKGGITGLVGESGSGKSTTARLITRLLKATSGKVFFDGQEVQGLPKAALRKVRLRIQMVFQDPYTSLNPRIRIREVLGTPLRLNRIIPPDRVEDRVVELLEMVGLQAEHRHRYPHEFSGGQRQRISIARAMAMEPSLIIADEAVSGLDVSVRAQILNLFRRLQETKGLTYLFIAHDLSVVEHFCDQVVVMYGGKIVEVGPVDDLFNSPLHPYTEALITAIPAPDPRLEYKPRQIKGEVVNLINRPPGCVFQGRCPLSQGLCAEAEPPFEERKPGRWVACYFR
jgi:oligopeptide/dipeptide ABC transporter ATP-binding protein